MGVNILVSGEKIVDNYNSTENLLWDFDLEGNIVVEDGGWFSTGQLQLQLRILLSVERNNDIVRDTNERYLNPSQYQIGHYALTELGAVVRDDRIKYLRQLVTIDAPLINISNTFLDARKDFALTNQTRTGHAQQSSSFVVCGSSRGALPPPPAEVELFANLIVPLGSVCLTVALGETHFTEVNPFIEGTVNRVAFDYTETLLPTALSGVLWAGHIMVITYEVVALDARSSALATIPGTIRRGAVKPAEFAYECALGEAVRKPGTCPPGSFVAGQVQADSNIFSFGCGESGTAN